MNKEQIESKVRTIRGLNNFITLPCIFICAVMMIFGQFKFFWLIMCIWNVFAYYMNGKRVEMLESIANQPNLSQKRKIDELYGRDK